MAILQHLWGTVADGAQVLRRVVRDTLAQDACQTKVRQPAKQPQAVTWHAQLLGRPVLVATAQLQHWFVCDATQTLGKQQATITQGGRLGGRHGPAELYQQPDLLCNLPKAAMYGVDQQHIRCLQIPVHDLLAVQVRHALGNLSQAAQQPRLEGITQQDSTAETAGVGGVAFLREQ